MKIYKRIFNTPEYRKRYTGLYGSWYAMKQRCGNPNNKQYKDYGGRGIIYDKNWETFSNFKKDMERGYKRGLTIERIDTNGNYIKENCKWATRKEQNSNKRCNIVIEYNGQKNTLLEWKDILKIDVSYSTLRQRYYGGMPINQILHTSLYRPAKICQKFA
jgi:hypothetical protein